MAQQKLSNTRRISPTLQILHKVAFVILSKSFAFSTSYVFISTYLVNIAQMYFCHKLIFLKVVMWIHNSFTIRTLNKFFSERVSN